MEKPRRASVAKGSRGMFEQITPQFYKIIFELDIRQGKLDFPVKFARLYGNRLSSPVTLQIPTGANWRVKLLKREGKIWLEKGWKEFADYYSLALGHFVVFQHEGQSRFLVTIMDISTSEIEYPVGCRHSTPPKGSDHSEDALFQLEESVDEVVEILDDPSPVTGTGAKGTCSGTSKLERRVEGDKLKGRAASKIIASRGLKASVNFTSEYPSFKLIVEPEHLAYNCVAVPFYVVLRNLVVKKQTMVLEVGDEGWEVEFTRYDFNRTGRLSNGWLPFAQDNALPVGDVCAFELISPAVFKVTIFRGVGGMSS